MSNRFKYKNSTHKSTDRKRGGFSFVELVTIIGVMAILIAIFVPSLIRYTERSRAQTDSSAADEIVNAVTLALADDKVFNDVVQYSISDNVSCYIDKSTESGYTPVVTKLASGSSAAQYLFNADARQADEKPYYAAGNMRGVTITFSPTYSVHGNESYYEIYGGLINKFVKSDSPRMIGLDCAYLYNAIRQTVGDSVMIESQTYRNSEFTIFIRFGTSVSNDESNHSATQVYGQFSGTNLSTDVLYYVTTDRSTGDYTEGEGTPSSGSGSGSGSNNNSPNSDLLEGEGLFVSADEGIPAGGYYYVGVTGTQVGDYTTATEVYSIGDPLPALQSGDVFVYGDYEYRYNCYFHSGEWYRNNSQGGWGVRVLDTTKVHYANAIIAINGGVTNTMRGTYCDCASLLRAPVIPKTVTDMRSTFNRCYSLTTAPTIPNGVTNMRATFRYCKMLTSAPDIPEGVVDMHLLFGSCQSLEGTITINAKHITDYGRCFFGTNKRCDLVGTSPFLTQLAATDGYADLSTHDTVRVAASNPGSELGDVIPVGGTYYVGVGATNVGQYTGATKIYTAGDRFPTTVNQGDIYIYGDYEYRYQYHLSANGNTIQGWKPSSTGGWRVSVISRTKTSYEPFLTSINGKPVTDLTRTYMNCQKLVTAPDIPAINVTMDATFKNCKSLTSIQQIPSTITYLNETFRNCTSLSGVIKIDTSDFTGSNCFLGTSESIWLTGNSSKLTELAQTDGYSDQSERDNVRVLDSSVNTAKYTVKHWQLNVTGDKTIQDDVNYTLIEQDIFYGVVGAVVSPSVKAYVGFTSPSTIHKEVNGNGNTVVNYYYTRQLYDIDLNLVWDGVRYTYLANDDSPILFTVKINGKVDRANCGDYCVAWPYGTTYEIEVYVKSGYYWDGSVRTGQASGTVTGRTTYEPIILTNNETTYVIKHWQQNLGADPTEQNIYNYTLADTQTIVELSGKEVRPGTMDYVGFAAPELQTVTIAHDGSTTVNYYYTRQSYRFDVNSRVDGEDKNSTNPAVRFDIYINGELRYHNVGDCCIFLEYGTTYEVRVLAQDGYEWTGEQVSGSAPLSGVLTTAVAFRPILVSTTS